MKEIQPKSFVADHKLQQLEGRYGKQTGIVCLVYGKIHNHQLFSFFTGGIKKPERFNLSHAEIFLADFFRAKESKMQADPVSFQTNFRQFICAV